MIPQSLSAFIVDKPKENWRSFGDPSSPLLKVLRFDDEAAQVEAFAVAGFSPGATRVAGVGDIDVIGAVVDQEPVFGEPDSEGFPTIAAPATFLPGWYVNVLIEEAPAAGVGQPGVDRPLTAADVQAAIERHVDAVASQRAYSSAVSLASYVASTIPLWQAEAQAFVAWRDAVWLYALTELAKVQAGERPVPESTAAFVSELPAIEWPEAE